MVDLFSISDYIITTSKLEGFGMTYIEGWVANKPVIARKINFLCKDFSKNGIDLSHFYSKLDVNGKDFKDYTTNQQLKLINNIDYNKLQKELKHLIKFINSNNSNLIKKNKKIIIKNYSLKAYAKNLNIMIKKGLELPKEPKVTIDDSYLIDYFKK